MAPRYKVRIKDQAGVLVAELSHFRQLQYRHEVNGPGYYALTLGLQDPNRLLFEVDSQVEIWRSDLANGVPWYKEFEGLHRKPDRIINEAGDRTFGSYGFGYLDLLARRLIGYYATTAGALKSGPAENAIKDYVRENAGSLATLANGRLRAGVFPGVTVEADQLANFDGVLGTGNAAPTMGQTGVGDGRSAFSFDSGDAVTISQPELATAFRGDQGTVLMWVRIPDATVWADGARRNLVFITASPDYVFLTKSTVANQVSFWYFAGGVFENVTDTSLAGSTDWFMLALTWDAAADELKAYINGGQVSLTQTGLGVWGGVLSGVSLGGTVGAFPGHKGLLAHTALFDRVIGPAELAVIYAARTADLRGAVMAQAPVAYWMLDDDAGAIAVSETTEGARWTGDRAWANLLKTIQAIGETTGVRFDMVGNGAAAFDFRSYLGQRGTDRRTLGLNPATGLNAAGNAPLVFSFEAGTMKAAQYVEDYTTELAAAIVLGQEGGTSRVTAVRESAEALARSPWNSAEACRNANNEPDPNALAYIGDQMLVEGRSTRELAVVPQQSRGVLYGRDYTWGDLVTVRMDDVVADKEIVAVTVTVGADQGGETIDPEFADIVG